MRDHFTSLEWFPLTSRSKLILHYHSLKVSSLPLHLAQTYLLVHSADTDGELAMYQSLNSELEVGEKAKINKAQTLTQLQLLMASECCNKTLKFVTEQAESLTYNLGSTYITFLNLSFFHV